jgi:hypothetical protein
MPKPDEPPVNPYMHRFVRILFKREYPDFIPACYTCAKAGNIRAEYIPGVNFEVYDRECFHCSKKPSAFDEYQMLPIDAFKSIRSKRIVNEMIEDGELPEAEKKDDGFWKTEKVDKRTKVTFYSRRKEKCREKK